MSNAITAITIESLVLLERKLAEIEVGNEDRIAKTNELLVYQFLISKLRADAELLEHLARISLELDALKREGADDRAIVAAVVRDQAETRRLTMAAIDRVDILAANVNAAMDRLSDVSQAAQQQAADFAAAEARAAALAGDVAGIKGELEP